MASPVTVTVRRETSPERAGEAAAWIDEGLALARGFEGSLGGGMLRLGEHENVMQVVYRFRDENTLERWEHSPERREWLRHGEALASTVRVQRRTGIEGWFDGPGLAQQLDARTGAVRTIGVRSAPRRWKQSCAIAIGMYPMNLLTAGAASLLPWWEQVPLAVRSAAVVAVLAPLMTFLMMPVVTRLLRGWLRRDARAIRSERSLREALDAQASLGL